MNKLKTISVFVFSILLLNSAISVSAAEAAGPMGFNVLTIEVKPGTQAVFEQFVVKYKEAADKIGTIPSFFASSPGVGDNTIYTFVTPFNSFADLSSQQQVLQKVYEPEEVAKLLSMFSDSVVASSSATYHPRSDLSKPAAVAIEAPEVVMAVSVVVHPGMAADFETWIAKLKSASENQNWLAYSRSFGAGPEYAFRIPGNWSDFDTPAGSPQARILAKFGAMEGAKINAQGAAAMASISQTLTRTRADLSHIMSTEEVAAN